MRVCLIAEKPSLALTVLPVIWEMHPDLEPDAFAYASVHPYSNLNIRFRYPRGLCWKDYPFAGAPEYAPFRFEYLGRDGEWTHNIRLCPRIKVEQETYGTGEQARTYDSIRWANPPERGFDTKPEAERRFRAADVVYCAVDPGDSSWLALDHALGHLSLPPATEVRTPLIECLWSEELRSSFRNAGRAGDAVYAAKVLRACISRRFDYGYQVNALAVLRRTMEEAGVTRGVDVPSKFAVQTLYLLRARGPLTEGYLIDAMADWRGTGRYEREPYRGIGNAASQSPIVEYLKASGLAEVDGRMLRVSPLGHRFLGLLHPDCEDPDLRFRIDAWKGMPEEEANARVDRYLRTFFGKQIRYLAKAADRGCLRA